MKKFFAFSLSVLILLTFAVGCHPDEHLGHDDHGIEPTSFPTDTLSSLPLTLTVPLSGEENWRLNFGWDGNNCYYQIPNDSGQPNLLATCRFDPESNTLTVYNHNQEKETVMFVYRFDADGYLTGFSYPSENVEGTITYTDDHNALTLDLGKDGQITGTKKDNTILFIQPGNDQQTEYLYEYGRHFLTGFAEKVGEIKHQTTSITTEMITDDQMTLTYDTVLKSVAGTDTDSFHQTYLLSVTPVEHSWHRIAGYLNPNLFGITSLTAKTVFLGAISLCYVR